MLSLRSFAVIFTLFIFVSTSSCGNIDELPNMQGLQTTGYTGPPLKLPLWAPFKWYVTTPVGGVYPDGTKDTGHTDRNYHSIDFDDYLIDGAGIRHANVNGMTARTDGSLYYPKIIPVLAAADGLVVDVVNSDCVQRGKACIVLLEHENGYHTLYLHFINESIVVKKGDPIKSGQMLGYIGTTGKSDGTHLHFELLKREACSSKAWALWEGIDSAHCYQGWQNDPVFQGVTLEGRPWTDYKVGSFYPSTNGFTFNSASNPTLCSEAPTGSASTNWVYTCTPKVGQVKVKEAVFGLIGIEKIAHNFGWKAEVVNPKGTVIQTYQWDASGVDPWGWDRSYYWPWVYPDTSGKWELRYFVKTNDSFPTYPMAVLPFTVVDTPPYTYNGNGQTCSDKPTGSASTNWVYTCKEPKSSFSSAFNPTVYGLLYVENIFKNFKFVTKVFYNGQYLFTHDPVSFTIVEPWVWRYAYAFPEIQRPLPGNWRMEVYLVYADGTPGVHLKDVSFTVTL